MKKTFQRLLSLVLTVLLLLPAVPSARGYELGMPWQPDLSEFISNRDSRQYVQMMLDYYLRNDNKIQSALRRGHCAVFLFEGCSDNMDDPELEDLSYYRVGAVCVVVKLDETGYPQVLYFNGNCSTLPDRPLQYGAWSFADFGAVGPATVCDGTYELYSVLHGGSYEALHLRESILDDQISAVYMFQEGSITADASAINIHTRTSNHTASIGMWSAGCMLVGDGEWRQFEELMQTAYYSIYPWFYVGNPVGTVTINRLRMREQMYELYQDRTSVDTILALSECSDPVIYMEQCPVPEKFDTPLKLRTREATGLMTLPCSNATDARSLQMAFLPRMRDVTITGSVKNHMGNLWYTTEYEGQTLYIYSGDLEEIKEEIPFVTWWKRIFG